MRTQPRARSARSAPRSLRLFAICAALAVPPATASHAFAQPAASADTATLTRQRQLFDQGNKLYDQGKLPQAEAAYLEAWKLKKSYDVAGNLGNLEADLKKWGAAAEFLSYALREFPAGGKPAMRDALVARLAEVEPRVGKLRLRVNRPGAEVFVDGNSVGVAPLPSDVYVDPGPHLVEARLEGFPPLQINVNAAKGRVTDVPIVLAGEPVSMPIVIAGGAVAGAAAIAGAVLLGVSASKSSSANTLADQARKSGGCPVNGVNATGTCADLASTLKLKANLANAGLWSLVGAGVVGAATITYFFVGGGSGGGKSSGLVIAPVVTAQGGGAFLSGSF